MTWWLKRHCSHLYNMVVVFANTGKEREETLRFVERCDKEFGFNVVWVEAAVDFRSGKGTYHRIMSFETARRNGEPFEAVIAKYGIPNVANPVCSRELKERPIRSYAKSLGWKRKDYITAIGIRADEAARLNWENAKKEGLIYPLATMVRITQSDINSFWNKQSFDLELKSYEGNCDLCWKKSNRKLLTILSEDKSRAEWWEKMEAEYADFIPEGKLHNQKIKPPIRFYRGNTEISELIEDSEKANYTPAVDESKIIDRQTSMWDEDLDSSPGCQSSCDAFTNSIFKTA